MTFSPVELQQTRRLLCRLQDHIRQAFLTARAREGNQFARVVARTDADVIYRVDRISEAAIIGWFGAHWPKKWPVQVVMEGLEDGTSLTFPRGTPVGRTVFKCIIDPIDGTRNLMFDKRSAWILAGLAPQRGARTHLGDIVVAVMTELPTTKQECSDQVGAVRGRGIVATRCDLRSGRRRRFFPRPSRARRFDHGFASFAKFFPAGKALLAQLEETLWRKLGLFNRGGSEVIFDDQYLTTGGQIYELLTGHDRMIADLRPFAFSQLGLESALSCHPYDICTALILQEAGGIVETPEGRALRAPLDTTTAVSWVGYANPHLARQIRPVLRRILHEKQVR
ncbi:MAG: inositol monophosphatase [Opitutaceae bacterium]|nr:inositol monophosphatase [Opitutaceae bacterium]